MAKIFVIGMGFAGYILAATVSAAAPTEVTVIDDLASVKTYTPLTLASYDFNTIDFGTLPEVITIEKVKNNYHVSAYNVPKAPFVPKRYVRYVPRGSL